MKKTKTTKAPRFTKLSPFSVSPTVQNSFITLAALAYVTQFALLLTVAIQQAGSNTNFSSAYGYAADALVLPAVIFSITYLLSPIKDRLGRLFESTLFTGMGLLLAAIVNQIFLMITIVDGNNDFSSLLNYRIADIFSVANVASVIVFGLVVYSYQRLPLKKR